MQDLSSPTRDLGIEPGPPAVEMWSPNHWAARGVLYLPLSVFEMEEC